MYNYLITLCSHQPRPLWRTRPRIIIATHPACSTLRNQCGGPRYLAESSLKRSSPAPPSVYWSLEPARTSLGTEAGSIRVPADRKAPGCRHAGTATTGKEAVALCGFCAVAVLHWCPFLCMYTLMWSTRLGVVEMGAASSKCTYMYMHLYTSHAYWPQSRRFG